MCRATRRTLGVAGSLETAGVPLVPADGATSDGEPVSVGPADGAADGGALDAGGRDGAALSAGRPDGAAVCVGQGEALATDGVRDGVEADGAAEGAGRGLGDREGAGVLDGGRVDAGVTERVAIVADGSDEEDVRLGGPLTPDAVSPEARAERDASGSDLTPATPPSGRRKGADPKLSASNTRRHAAKAPRTVTRSRPRGVGFRTSRRRTNAKAATTTASRASN
jgi:hypothetical protein